MENSTMLMNMKDLLAVAHANHFAVPAFNISNNIKNLRMKKRITAGDGDAICVAFFLKDIQFVFNFFQRFVSVFLILTVASVAGKIAHGCWLEP